jgi:hypothetical protein
MSRVLIKLTLGGINEGEKDLLRSPGSDPVIWARELDLHTELCVSTINEFTQADLFEGKAGDRHRAD